MSPTENESRTETDRSFRAASAEQFVEAMKRSWNGAAATGELEDIDRVRSAFASVMEEVFGGKEAAPAVLDFPGHEILEKAGQGAFGVVYRARDVKLGREVALKVQLPRFGPLSRSGFDPSARERFLREARALARIRHPNVLAVHAVLEHEERVALVTEFIEGEPLSAILETRGPLGPSEAAQTGVEICRALAAVHAAGLVHRDVKTANILRERGGRIVLADFGLGVFLDQTAGLEPAGLVAGSPLFMAPEQIRGEPLHPRVDLYALGVVLYNLVTGRFPVVASSIQDLLTRIKTGALIPLRDVRPDLPGAFVEVVSRAIALDPDHRFPTAGAMEAALLGSLVTPVAGRLEKPGGDAVTPIPIARARVSRRGALRAAGIAAALVPITLLVPFLLPRGGPVVETELRRWEDGFSRALTDGDRIQLGDAIGILYRAEEALHVYVINEDEKSHRKLLFPVGGGRLQNPLPGGIFLELPGVVRGQQLDWKVDSPGGKDWIHILASPRPIEALERQVLQGLELAAYPDLGEREVEDVLRGIGGLEPRKVSSVASGSALLGSILDELRGRGGKMGLTSGMWSQSY
ncbi:MAG TPA: protein kinase, partial [Planctomycetota bacterium]|nr:protein kinase [Planctomycetota bacterium]